MFKHCTKYSVAAILLQVFSITFNSHAGGVLALTYCDNQCAEDGYFCVENDPTAYSVCSSGVRIATMHCAEGFWWDSQAQSCNYPKEISEPQCVCPPAPAQDAPVQPDPTQEYCDNNCASNGYFCVPNDPTAFSVCNGGHRLAVMHCQAGLWWDRAIGACNWPAGVPDPQCPCGSGGSSSSTTSTTTRATTTTKKTTTTTKTTMAPTTTKTTTNAATTTTSSGGGGGGSGSNGFHRVCYITNWAVYRNGPASYSAQNVDPSLCTHIIIAFMNLANGQISYLEAADGSTIETLNGFKTEYPDLKILVAIGGWNAGSWPFMEVVASEATMNTFISQAIQFLRNNNLDGLDIDWEYPQGYITQFSTWMAVRFYLSNLFFK